VGTPSKLAIKYASLIRDIYSGEITDNDIALFVNYLEGINNIAILPCIQEMITFSTRLFLTESILIQGITQFGFF